eukprot:Platyproteum_vivax@DN6026_c0_g1_i3.p1
MGLIVAASLRIYALTFRGVVYSPQTSLRPIITLKHSTLNSSYYVRGVTSCNSKIDTQCDEKLASENARMVILDLVPNYTIGFGRKLLRTTDIFGNLPASTIH